MLPTLPLSDIAAGPHNTTVTRDNLFMVKLAREIASDIRSLDAILKSFMLSRSEWDSISQHAGFQKLLASAVEEWNSAANTPDRVRVKSMAFVEEALPELYARMHDAKEPLSAKVQLLQTVSKMAGVGGNADAGQQGEKLVVNISLGDDRKLTIVKDVTPNVQSEASEALADLALSDDYENDYDYEDDEGYDESLD